MLDLFNQLSGVIQSFFSVVCLLFLNTCLNNPQWQFNPTPSPFNPKVAIESKKQAANLPRPPFPNEGSNSISSISANSLPLAARTSLTSSYNPKFIKLFDNNLPIKNSAEIQYNFLFPLFVPLFFMHLQWLMQLWMKILMT